MPTPTTTDVENALRQAAVDGIAKATTDAGTVETHSLPDQIAATKFLRSTEAAASKRRGLRLSTLVPPGAD